MAGFAEILGGIGQAMREDRIREQEQNEQRARGIADLLMKDAEDENLTPGQSAERKQAALRIWKTGKFSNQDQQMLVDSVLRMNMPAPPATQAPMPQPGDDAAAESYRPVLEAPPGGGRGPTVADIKADRQAKAREKELRMVASINESLAKTKYDREQKERADLAARYPGLGVVNQARLAMGEPPVNEVAPTPLRPEPPKVVGGRLISATGEVLYEPKKEEEIDPVVLTVQDDISGTVTQVARDKKTGRELWRGGPETSRKRPPAATRVSVYAGQEVDPYVGALAKGEMTLSQVPLAIRDKVLKQANAQGIKIVSDVERQALAQTGKITPVLASISELSEKINTGRGVLAKVTGAVERAKAQANLNDDVAEYEAMVLGFTPLVARAVGHVGVLTEQDVVSVRTLFPKPGDSKSLRDRKIARLKTIIGGVQEQLKKATTEPIAGGGLTPPPAAGGVPQVGQTFEGKRVTKVTKVK